MKLADKITVIIPTFNRQKYALRNMRYWSGRGPTVHVLDGSATPINAFDISELNENIHYHHLPMSGKKRLKYAFDLIETSYCVLLSDDEFLIPKGLEACISEMDTDRELVSCIGRFLVFNPTSRGVVGWPAYTKMKDYALLQDDPLERMITHMNPYTSTTFFSVVRTPVWKKACSTMVKKDFRVYAIGELQFELSVSYLGKSKVIPELYYLRSSETKPVPNTANFASPEIGFLEWWTDSSRHQEREEFLKIMASTLVDTDQINTRNISDDVFQALDTYAAFVVRRNALKASEGKPRTPWNLMAKWIPAPLKRLIRDELAWFHPDKLSQPLPLLQAAEEMKCTSVRVDLEALREIESIVCSFHEQKTKEYGIYHGD